MEEQMITVPLDGVVEFLEEYEQVVGHPVTPEEITVLAELHRAREHQNQLNYVIEKMYEQLGHAWCESHGTFHPLK